MTTETNSTHTWSCRAVGEHTAVVTVNEDLTNCVGVGDRHMFTHDGVMLGFTVTGVSYDASISTITLYGGVPGSVRNDGVQEGLLDSLVYACLPADNASS